MTKPAKPCVRLFKWLQAQFGKRCLAALTGTDARALDAAVQIAELWTVSCRTREVAAAFAIVVGTMQPGTRWLAYHAIAMVGDWSFRDELWRMAALDWNDVRGLASFGPGGSGKDMSKA